MVALFAVGVITGTILSFEMGLLWPNFTATFGSVFGLGFAIEGFSFFMEAIFIGIYVYGWDRLSPRAHFASRHPDRDHRLHRLADGDRGQRLDEPPRPASRCVDGRVVDVHPSQALFGNCVPLARARPHVPGRLHRHRASWSPARTRSARLRGRWGRYERTALAIPLTIAALAAPVQVLVGDWAAREVADDQPTKLAALEGLPTTTRGAPEHLLGWYTDGRGQVRDRDPAAALAARLPRPERDGAGARRRARRPTAAGQRRAGRVPDDGRHRHAAGAARRGLPVAVRVRRRRLPESRWFYRAVVLAGPAVAWSR